MLERSHESTVVDGCLNFCAVAIIGGALCEGGRGSWFIGGGAGTDGIRSVRGLSVEYGNEPAVEEAAEAGIFGVFGLSVSRRSSYSPQISSSPSGAPTAGIVAVGTAKGMKPELLDPVDNSEFLRGGKLKNSAEPFSSSISSDPIGDTGCDLGSGFCSRLLLQIDRFWVSEESKLIVLLIELRKAGEGCKGLKGREKDPSEGLDSRSLRDTT